MRNCDDRSIDGIISIPALLWKRVQPGGAAQTPVVSSAEFLLSSRPLMLGRWCLPRRCGSSVKVEGWVPGLFARFDKRTLRLSCSRWHVVLDFVFVRASSTGNWPKATKGRFGCYRTRSKQWT